MLAREPAQSKMFLPPVVLDVNSRRKDFALWIKFLPIGVDNFRKGLGIWESK